MTTMDPPVHRPDRRTDPGDPVPADPVPADPVSADPVSGDPVSADRLEQLGSVLTGSVSAPTDSGWDLARRAWNLTADQRPDLVAYPETTEDVATIVRAAARHGRKVALQATGHGAGALASLEGAILVRTDRLRGVGVDAAARRATVRAGTRSEDLVDGAASQGLAFLAGSSGTVGVVGYTLGGGLGWLGRRYGLACNTVVSAEVVTADGEVRRVDHDHEPLLFWALRGGGGSFAAVTQLEVELFPLATVTAGALSWPLGHADVVLRRWRDWIQQVPDTVTSCARLLRYPPLPQLPDHLRGRAFVTVEATILGDASDAATSLAPLRELRPTLDTVHEQGVAALQGLHGDPRDPVPASTDHRLLGALPDAALDAVLAVAGPDATAPLLSLDLRQLGGALGRSHPSYGVLDRLDAEVAMFAVGVPVDADARDAIDLTFARLAAAMQPFDAGTSYLNFADRPVDVLGLFGQERSRQLQAIRASYDPDARFLANHPVPLP